MSRLGTAAGTSTDVKSGNGNQNNDVAELMAKMKVLEEENQKIEITTLNPKYSFYEQHSNFQCYSRQGQELAQGCCQSRLCRRIAL